MIEFGEFQVDTGSRQLFHAGQVVALTPKGYAVLIELINAKGALVTKQALMKKIWKDTIVTDAALTVCIREIRKALGENARTPRHITTLHKRGYCFKGNINNAEGTLPYSDKQQDNHETTSLVKRKLESKQLANALSRAASGQRQLVFVCGEAGLGKTTLVESFISDKDLQSITITRGQCIEHYGHAEPYLPWLDAFTKLCRKDTNLLKLFKQFAPMWLLHMPSLLSNDERDELERRLAGTSSERMTREMLETLDEISLQSPMIIYLEDLHFSDSASVQLLSGFAHRRGPSQLMIIACYRPTELALKNHPLKVLKQDLEVRGYCHEIQLDPFSKQQVRDYIDKRFPNNGFPQSLAKSIELRSDGNPLFIINVIEYLLKEQWIDKRNDNWELCCDEQTVKTCLPENLMQMLGYHIEQLPQPIQQLLEAAAVTCNSGTGDVQFSIAPLAYVLGNDPDLVEDQCQQLSRSQHFITHEKDPTWLGDEFEATYCFTHGLYQQAFYQRLTTSKRAGLHQKMGLYLESVYPAHDLELDSKLAVHYEQGRDYSKAAYYLKKYAQTASQRGVYSEAKKSLMRAQALSNRISNEITRKQITLDIYISLGPILIAEKGNTDHEVEENYLNAHALCQQVGNAQKMFPIVFGLRSYNLLSGHLNKAHDLSKNLLFIANEVDDQDQLLEAHVGLASTAFFLGDFRQSLTHAKNGLQQYRPECHAFHVKHYGLDPGVFCYSRAAQTLWALGYADQALDQVSRSLNLAKQLEHPYSLAFAHNNHAWINLYREEPESTLKHAFEAVKLAREYGFPFYKVWGQIMQGWAICSLGDSKKGILLAHTSIEESISMASAIRSYLLTVMADIHLRANDYNKGLAVLDNVNQNAEYFLKTQRYHLRGQLQLIKYSQNGKTSKNDFHNAVDNFKKAIDCAQKQNAKSFELQASTSLATLYFNQGQSGKAYTTLKPIVDWFEQIDSSADLTKAKTLLSHCNKDKIINLEKIKIRTKKNTA